MLFCVLSLNTKVSVPVTEYISEWLSGEPQGLLSWLLPTELRGKTIGDDTTHFRYGSQDCQPGTKLEASLWWLAFIVQKALWLLGDKTLTGHT